MREIRFTVRNQGGQRAATWKCWSPPGKEDVYLTCREVSGALKASLHESGNWHIAYFEGFFEESVPEEHRTERGRFIDQWSRPKPIAPGITLAFRIITPWSSYLRPAIPPNPRDTSAIRSLSPEAPHRAGTRRDSPGDLPIGIESTYNVAPSQATSGWGTRRR